MLGAPGYAPVSTQQSEVGAFEMGARDIKINLRYQKYLMNCENELVRKIYEEVIQDEAGDWSLLVYLLENTVGQHSAGGSNLGKI